MNEYSLAKVQLLIYMNVSAIIRAYSPTIELKLEIGEMIMPT